MHLLNLDAVSVGLYAAYFEISISALLKDDESKVWPLHS
jgi:hypothetical protein